jgi:6-phosphogluconolactonase (cycloisomerase 2 family)
MQSKVLFGLAAATALFGACESTESQAPASPEAGAGGQQAAGAPSGGAGSGADEAGAAGVPVGSAGSASGGEPTVGEGGAAGADASPGGAANGGSSEGGAANGGGEGGDGGESDVGVPAVAYVSTVLGRLFVASLAPEDGAPALLPSSPVEVPGFLHGVAVSHTGKFLFVVAEPSRIDTYPIAADGSLPDEPTSSTQVDDDNPLLSVALDPQSRFAYGVSPFSNSIYVFEIDPQTGALTPSGDPVVVGAPPDHRRPAFVAPDPTGQFVYVTQMAGASVADNGIRGYRVDQENGSLSELADSPFDAGDVVAGAVVFRPDGKFLFSSGGGVNAFSIAADSGKLTLVEGSPFSVDSGSDPWAPNIAIDPQGRRLYVSNFLQTQHVSGFAIDRTTGALSELPGSPVTSIAPYSIAMGPGGRSLYVGNDNGQVSVFRVGASGELSALAGSPFAFGGLEPDFAFVTLP